MAFMLSMLVGLIAIATAIFNPLAAWLLYVCPVAYLVYLRWSVSKSRWKPVPELSDRANALLKQFGHFYAMPFAGNDFSGAASGLAFIGPAIAVAGLYQGSWRGIPVGVVSYFVLVTLAQFFNPTQFYKDEADRDAHEELVSYAERWQRERQGPQ